MCCLWAFGVKKAYKSGQREAFSWLFGKNTLNLQPLAASAVVGRRSWHTYKWRLQRLTILLSKTRTFRRNRSGQKPRSSSVGSSKCRCYVGMIIPYGIAVVVPLDIHIGIVHSCICCPDTEEWRMRVA